MHVQGCVRHHDKRGGDSDVGKIGSEDFPSESQVEDCDPRCTRRIRGGSGLTGVDADSR